MKKIFQTTTLGLLSFLPTSVLALEAYDSPDVTIKEPATTDLANVLGLVISWVLLLVGGLAVLFLIWGGLQYVTSSGNKDKAEQAKKTITYAVVGLIVIVLARVIVSLVTGLPLSLGLSSN